MSAVFIVIALAVLMAFVSLAVDMGRVWLARAQMQTVADAAARAGTYKLPISTRAVIDEASEAALSNQVIDAAIVNGERTGGRTNPGVDLYPDEDVVFGTWNPVNRVFTEIEDRGGTQSDERRRANAVRAHGKRNEDRDNPLTLIFGPVIGVFHIDIERDAIAYISGGPSNFGFVGIDHVRSNGEFANIRSMLTGTKGVGGGVASDGDIRLGNGDVYGDARPGMNHDVIQGPNSLVTGWQAALDYTLADLYPVPKVSDIPNDAEVVTLPGNNEDWILPPGGPPSNDPNNPKHLRLNGDLEKLKSITVHGYVKLWVNGDVDVKGASIINNGNPPNPSKFEIVVVGQNRTVDVGGTATQYCHVYAPGANVRIHGTPGFYGWIIGKSLDFLGTSYLYYDESRNQNNPYTIRLVK